MKNCKSNAASSGRLGVHPRILDLYSEFLTRDESLCRQQRMLLREPNASQTILVCGPTAVGKTAFCLQAWKNIHNSRRPLIHEQARFVPGEKELVGLFRRAEGGDLILQHISELAAELLGMLPALIERYPNVRILATSGEDPQIIQTTLNFQKIITIPPLRDRREDIRLIISTLLTRNGAMTCSSSAMELMMSKEWHEEFPQLSDCVFKSSWFARGENRTCVSLDDVTKSLSYQHVDLWFMQTLMNPAVRYTLARKGLKAFLRDLEAVTIAAGLVENNGNLSRLARNFQVPINTLLSRCKNMKDQLGNLQELMNWGTRNNFKK